MGQWVVSVTSDTKTGAISPKQTSLEHALGGRPAWPPRLPEVFAPVRLWVLSDKQSVLILVWDSSPQPPARIDAAGDAENGRGLLLVEAMSTQWNWHAPHHLGGKVVWAQIGAEPR